MKYTKGPWKVDIHQHIQGHAMTVAIEALDGEPIIQQDFNCLEPHRTETLANASLISAAPEMLGVLEEIELQYSLGILGDETIEWALEIIAKARGDK